MTPSLRGPHHVSAIADDPQRTIDFYTGVLGLRLVKVTVDVDDPEAYHLYYGDGPVQDRVYYRSITVAEPGGVRLEVAAEGPGVTADEGAAQVGTHLAWPPWLERRRAQLTRVLPSLRLPRATLAGDAP
jgi:catechol 2,3-dioxygenase-like lactoylglutathione lyase family enzyme